MTPPDAGATAGARTVRMTLEYDGTNFVGWQIQSRGRSVQGELGEALSTLLREPVTPVGSGRTDAGVHAAGQVAHFQTASDLSTTEIRKGLNGLTAPDIAVLDVDDAAVDFHARYSALRKRYRYRICVGKTAIERQRVWTLYTPIDHGSMVQASRHLLGDHSFAAFCKRDPEPESFACTILDCSWERVGRELVFEIEANRFLRHMVRILVGTLVEVGCGRRPPRQMLDLLTIGVREQAGQTAPPQGLCLLEVTYPE